MASVRAGRRQLVLPGAGRGGKSLGVVVTMLVAVLAAIALIWSFSRRAPRTSDAPLASAEPAAAPGPPSPPAAEPEPALAATPAPAEDEREVAAAPSQRKIARVVDDGRDGLKRCYQRALVRDATLVHGRLNVRLTIAPSGRVDTVKITGPEAFRSVQPCVERTTARWTFPASAEPYAAEFPLVLQGAL
jgi:hypothetical protein